MYAVLCAAYDEEPDKDGIRVVLRLRPELAPYKVAVLPLSKKLSEKTQRIAADLRKRWNIFHDEAGNIGRRYRRQDEAGTPFCVTYVFDSETDARVTVRERDSMAQERISLDSLRAYLDERLESWR